MATDLCTRRLTKELKALKKEPITSPKMTVAPNEANILEKHAKLLLVKRSDKEREIITFTVQEEFNLKDIKLEDMVGFYNR